MIDQSLYPWLTAPAARLERQKQTGRLPHALLFSGPQGIGKRRLAQAWVHSLLCAQPSGGAACGHCRSCRLYRAGNHPDHFVLRPAEEGGVIVIDAVRNLIQWQHLEAHYGGWRVAMIEPAERMNAAAANSLLKTLEEPTHNTLILLVSDDWRRLPATVRSRCQHLALTPPPLETSRPWLAERVPDADVDTLLAMAGGAPLLAEALARGEALPRRQSFLEDLVQIAMGRAEPLEAADRHAKTAMEWLAQWMIGWIADLLRLQGGARDAVRHNPDYRDTLHRLAQGIGHDPLFRLLAVTYRVRRQLLYSQPNRQLLLEELLIAWYLASRPRSIHG